MEEDEFKFIINHVFLPRKLPNKIDDQAKYEASETNILIVTKNVIKNLSSMVEANGFNIDLYREIVRMFIVWKQMQNTAYLNAAMIRKQIKSLKENQSFPLYLRAQNSCIILEMLSNKQNYPVVLSSFRVSLSNEEVLSTTGDIYGKFPSASFYISNKSSIGSKVFSELIEDLGNKRIHDAESEIRNVPNDKFVNEWLTLFLAEDVPLSKYPRKVTKKIRDEILWKNCVLPFRRSGNFILDTFCFLRFRFI